MKTDQAERVLEADLGVDVTPRGVPHLDAPPQPPSTGRAFRRVTTGVLALLLIAVIAAVVAWVAMTANVDQATEDSRLFDQSIRAREDAAGASVTPAGSLLDRSIRAREPAAAVPELITDPRHASLLDARRADRAAPTAQHDSALDQSSGHPTTRRETPQADMLLHQSIRARER